MKQKIILLACFDRNDINVPAKQFDAFVGRVKEQARKAERAGVTLGLEGECTVEYYKKVLDRIGSPAVKAYFDTQHAHRPGRDVVQEITFLKDQICEFHAKDYTSILLGQGKIDFTLRSPGPGRYRLPRVDHAGAVARYSGPKTVGV